MTRRPLVLPLALLLIAAGPAERVKVAAVTDGDTLLLEDGRSLRLAGIDAAKPPPGADPDQGWSLAAAATAALSDLTLGREVVVRGEATVDRHGRLLAQVERADGLWLQGALLDRGLARVHTRPDARDRAGAMLAAEAAARRAERGLWRTSVYAVRPAKPEALARDRDSFQIVEGRVLRVTKAGGDAYLDFGEDWRTDVTVHIGRGALRAFQQARIDPLSFEGRLVRVRGWVGLRNGPMIAITHPEQIERLEDGPSPPPRRSGPAAAKDAEPRDESDEPDDGDVP